MRVAGDGQIDGATITFKHAVDKREIGLLRSSLTKVCGEFRVGGIVFSDEDGSGGLPVEPVHDARAQQITAARECMAATEERVDQRTFGGAGPGMHRHTSRL